MIAWLVFCIRIGGPSVRGTGSKQNTAGHRAGVECDLLLKEISAQRGTALKFEAADRSFDSSRASILGHGSSQGRKEVQLAAAGLLAEALVLGLRLRS